MSVCDELDATLKALSAGWSCEAIAGRDTAVLVFTGRYYADGDQVAVVVEQSDGAFMVRDANAAARLDLAGANRETSRKVEQYWDAIVEDYGCLTAAGRVYLHSTPERLELALGQIADALVTLDGIRHAAPPGRGDRFSQRVREWLRTQVELPVRDDRIITTVDGGTRRVTAIVDPPAAPPLVVMAAQRASGLAPIEHAYFVLDQLSADSWPIRRRMTILGGAADGWKDADRAALARVGYVASLEQAVTVGRVLRGELTPDSTDLLELDPGQARFRY